MGASDLIKALQNTLQEGAVHIWGMRAQTNRFRDAMNVGGGTKEPQRETRGICPPRRPMFDAT